jgi:hypothetical protein
VQYNAGGGDFGAITALTDGQIVVGQTGAPPLGKTMSQDGTLSAGGVLTVTKTNNVSFSTLAITTPGTGVAAALGTAIGTAGAPVLFNGVGGTPSSLTLTNALGLPVSGGGTGLSNGTSGGILGFTASGVLNSSGVLTANLPVIGGGAGATPTVGTRSGNTTAYVTTTGSQTSGKCVEIDASGNHIAAANACGTGGGGGSGVGVQGGQSVSGIGDNTTALPAAKYVYATNATMTAPRAHNLPDSVTQGEGDIEIIDTAQTVTSTNTLTVAAAGTDTLNGVTNGSQVIYSAGGSLRLHNDGAGAWILVNSNTIPTLTQNQIYVGNSSSRPTNVTMSQDCTLAAGVITCLKTNNVSFGALATVVAGTGAATALAVNTGSAGAFQLNSVSYSMPGGWIPTVNPNNVVIGTMPAAATITSIVGSIETATGGTSTVSVYKAPSGTACSAGTVLHSGSINANGTAATNQTLTVTTASISSGNRLCLQTTGTTGWTTGTGSGGVTVNYTIP